MPRIEIAYKPNVSRRAVSIVVNTLSAKACRQDLIPSESVDIYTRRLGKLDRQDTLIVVRIYADPRTSHSREDIDRIEERIWLMLGERVRPTHIGVEVITAPAASPGL